VPRSSVEAALRCLVFALVVSPAAGLAVTPQDLFEQHIRPLLVTKCAKCHGEEKSESGLRVTSRQELMTGGDSGPAIVPGDATRSLLLAVLRPGGDVEMPPDGPLSGAEVAAVERWVESGAVWPGGGLGDGPRKTRSGEPTDEERAHWAYQPPVDFPVPTIAGSGTAALHPVDAFTRARLLEEGIAPVRRADKSQLLRRVTYGLTGLPPEPADLDAFEADTSSDAFAQVVERLLASPAYGERWGRHWLDLVRYADTAGETGDYPVPLAWKYRNYVIASLNADKPYDQFLREQIAGDLLADPTDAEAFAERITATGFLAISRRFGFDSVNSMHLTYQDTIDTLGQATLGLTLGCARCHDHKYDALTAADYYALYGIFASTRLSFPGDEQTKRPRDLVSLLPPAELVGPRRVLEARLAVAERLLRDAEETRKELEDRLTAAKETGDVATISRLEASVRQATASISGVQKQRDAIRFDVPYPVAFGAAEGRPETARIQKRGEPDRLGEEVPRRFLAVLGGQPLPPAELGSGRRQLADWIASPANPLAARVVVNRVWQHHFGEGLVSTENDFGVRGSPPTHPKLLDWLACRFVEQGWSLKRLHRLILSSDTYQRATMFSAAAAEVNPDNSLLWRFPRRRLAAEEIRDTLLLLGGTLDRTPGEGHPFPAVESWAFSQHRPFADLYDTPRRSVYLMTPRLGRHPLLALFDGADPNATTPDRGVTTVPTQALFWMNAPLVHQQSLGFAAALLTESDRTLRIRLAYRRAFGRWPSQAEQTESLEYVDRCEAVIAATDLPVDEWPRQVWASFARTLFAANEFLYLD
jgi:hypothetical protein